MLSFYAGSGVQQYDKDYSSSLYRCASFELCSNEQVLTAAITQTFDMVYIIVSIDVRAGILNNPVSFQVLNTPLKCLWLRRKRVYARRSN